MLPVTVIVPTRNEADNVLPLLERLLPLDPVRVIFVDDSDDRTPEVVSSYPDPRVTCIHRPPHERADGLGGAVLRGIRETATEWFVVMDGDLQHPPEVVPTLLLEGQRTGADVVVASRYAGQGSNGGLSDAYRVLVSSASIHLSRLLFPRRLRNCSDTMSGFFAVRTASVQPSSLRPDGFKILLEIILTSSRPLLVSEVPFVFVERHAGSSKAHLREGFKLLRRLLQLRLRRR